VPSKSSFFGAHLAAEMLTFRVHRIPTTYRVQILQQCSAILNSAEHAGNPQLYCV
jgi:hypothetical protein